MSFRVRDRLWLMGPPALAGALALAVYARTLAPGLTWLHYGADGGDLLAAALTGGVPHPPGYPTYQILLRAWLSIVPGDPARAGNWLSAVCAGAAVAILAAVIRMVLAGRSGPGTPSRSAYPAVVVALAWGVSPGLWGQAVITEVYALHALFTVGLIWLLLHGRQALGAGESGRGWLALTAAVFGVGLGNHLTLALLAPAILVWLWRGADRPAPRTAGVGRAGRLPVGWASAAPALLAGLAVYAYLPWAAAHNSTPASWGAADTTGGLWWLVSARLYRPMVFGVELAWLPARLAAWAGEAVAQFGPWGVGLALAGLLRLEQVDRALWRLTLTAALLCSVYALGYDSVDSHVYLLPAWAMLAIWVAVGAQAVWDALVLRISRLNPSRSQAKSRSALRCGLALTLLLLPLLSVLQHWGAMDASQDDAAQSFVARALASAAPEGLILTSGDRTTFALWYAIYGLRQRPDLIPLNVNLYGFDWYRAHLRAYYPALAQDDLLSLPLEQALPRMAAQRPLYRAEALGIELTNLKEGAAGSLVQMWPR